MPWVVSFVVAWVVFLLLVDKSRLKRNVWAGLISVALASLVDWGGQKLDFYQFYDVIIPWASCSAFYKWGPVFTAGILFAQYVPKNKILQIFHIIASSLLFLSLEHTIILTGAAKYVHWNSLASFIVDILTLSTLTWITQTFLRKNKTAA